MLNAGLSALAENVAALVVMMKSGEKVHYVLDEKPKVTYKDNNMLVTAKEVMVTQALDEVQKLTFEEVEKGDTPTSVTVPLSDGYVVDLRGGQLRLSGFPVGSPVRIYDMNGRMVQSIITDAQGSAATVLPQHGVYVVKTDVTSFKLYNR